MWVIAGTCSHETRLTAPFPRHDEKIAKEFGVEGGSVLHVSWALARHAGIMLTLLVAPQLVLALRGGIAHVR